MLSIAHVCNNKKIPGFRIHLILMWTRIRIFESTFGYSGSGSSDPPFGNSRSGSPDPPLEIVDPDPGPDPDPAPGNYFSLIIFIHDLYYVLYT